MYIQLLENVPYENCSHVWETFRYFSPKHIFKPCSHIQSNTQNPKPIFKISVYYTKHTYNVKIHSENYENNRENKKPIFFKSLDFKMISVLWRFSWPAFCGPKILVYIYIFIYIYVHIYIYIYIFIYIILLYDSWGMKPG